LKECFAFLLLSSEEGVQQGDALGPLFSMALDGPLRLPKGDLVTIKFWRGEVESLSEELAKSRDGGKSKD